MWKHDLKFTQTESWSHFDYPCTATTKALWLREYCFCFQVSLSLEEKQKLAREQEQQHLYKKQTPLVPKENKSVNNNIANSSNNKQPKDLTSTLLNNNLNQLQRSSTLNSSWNPPPSTNTAFMSSPLSGSMGNNSIGGGGTMMQRTNSLTTPVNKPVDLSAFDNLLSPTSSSQAKPSLNQMAKKSPNSSMPGMGMNATGMGLLGGGGGGGNMRMMGTGPMIGAGQNTMMGHSMQMPMIAAQPIGGTNFSHMGMGTANQNQFGSLGTVKAQNGLSSTNSIGNELDDLFGWKQ